MKDFVEDGVTGCLSDERENKVKVIDSKRQLHKQVRIEHLTSMYLFYFFSFQTSTFSVIMKRAVLSMFSLMPQTFSASVAS